MEYPIKGKETRVSSVSWNGRWLVAEEFDGVRHKVTTNHGTPVFPSELDTCLVIDSCPYDTITIDFGTKQYVIFPTQYSYSVRMGYDDEIDLDVEGDIENGTTEQPGYTVFHFPKIGSCVNKGSVFELGRFFGSVMQYAKAMKDDHTEHEPKRELFRAPLWKDPKSNTLQPWGLTAEKGDNNNE